MNIQAMQLRHKQEFLQIQKIKFYADKIISAYYEGTEYTYHKELISFSKVLQEYIQFIKETTKNDM